MQPDPIASSRADLGQRIAETRFCLIIAKHWEAQVKSLKLPADDRAAMLINAALARHSARDTLRALLTELAELTAGKAEG